MSCEDMFGLYDSAPWLQNGTDGLYLVNALDQSGFSKVEAADMALIALDL